ncbi:MAG: helix-turn-helix transcriptional regulator [Clostridia bacterium]|nr:helix-turn-helix transcriptional regulator [Clostridia bacterium]
MSETMGQIIRKLRKERNLTQEELAEQLNITYQAISRWENETGMPDISQIVPLANVFEVTTDVLFGISGCDTSKEVDEFLAAHSHNWNNKPENISDFAFHQACCNDIQDMLSKYPNHYKLLDYSLDHLIMLLWDYYEDRDSCSLPNRYENMKKLQDECIRQAEVILHHCQDSEYRSLANRRLISVYRIMGNYEKAMEHAKQIFSYNGFQVGVVYDSMGHSEDAIREYSHTLYTKLIELEPILPAIGYQYMKQGKYEEAYSCYNLQIEVFEKILERSNIEEMNHGYLSYNPSYDWCAAVCVKLGEYEKAMELLERWICMERKAAQKQDHVKTSILPYFSSLDLTPYHIPYTREKRITPSLDWESFDSIRDTDRFKKILADAEAFELSE